MDPIRPILNSNLEILPWESGKTYLVTQTFTVSFKGKYLTVTEGFKHDRYSVVPDLADAIPAICHDFAYTFRKWDDGTEITRSEADGMLYFLMQASTDKATRDCANLYYQGLRLLGWYVWYFGKGSK